MKKVVTKKILIYAFIALIVLFATFLISLNNEIKFALASDGSEISLYASEAETASGGDNAVPMKAIGAAIVVGLAGLGGAIAMGMAIAKAGEGISRQPESADKIRSTLMLGLVFIETVVIYALIVAILVIFVL